MKYYQNVIVSLEECIVLLGSFEQQNDIKIYTVRIVKKKLG